MSNPKEPREWEKRFDREFVFRGDFGERKLAYFRPENLNKKTPIIKDDQIVIDLEDFIYSVEQEARKEGAAEERIKIVEIIERWGGSRFRGGYENSELYQIISSLTTPEEDKGL